MTGFEPRIYGIGNNRSANWVTATALFAFFLSLSSPFKTFLKKFRPLVPTKYTASYALFANLDLSNYTFFVTSENELGTAHNTSTVFVPQQRDGTWRDVAVTLFYFVYFFFFSYLYL